MIRILWLFVIGTPAITFADTLQLEIGQGGPFASYAQVQLLNPQGNEVYNGTADGYGRVSASLPAGDYRVIVRTRNGTKEASVHLSGANVLQPITL